LENQNLLCKFAANMDKLSSRQRHIKATMKREQSDACISSAEREQARRSANMAAIRSKDTKPEMIVRRGLWKRGFRYRLNDKRLPGHPDLVLRKYRTCIFVNGCFWHGHKSSLTPCPSPNGEGSNYQLTDSECCRIPKTNREFWEAKIRRNKERDKEEQKKLAAMGWHCITVWECELKPSEREKTLESIAFTLNHIWLQDHQAKVVPYPLLEEEEMQMPMAAEESPDERNEK
jgi:DNA mismatch endonuclease (patch repair protein)